MTKMIRFYQTGDASVLHYEEGADTPIPEGREVLLRHTIIGVNFIDTYHRSGSYAVPHLPAIPGVEAVGVVEAVGSEVMYYMPGDRVAIRGTQLIINGQEVPSLDKGNGIIEETLPGGTRYRVFAPYPMDMPLHRVAEGMYFLLADNRAIYQDSGFLTHPLDVETTRYAGKVWLICKYPCPLKTKL